jgi:hypothetical protein
MYCTAALLYLTLLTTVILYLPCSELDEAGISWVGGESQIEVEHRATLADTPAPEGVQAVVVRK